MASQEPRARRTLSPASITSMAASSRSSIPSSSSTPKPTPCTMPRRHNDWSQVKPEIFGTLFQQSMDAARSATSATPSARTSPASSTSRKSSAPPSSARGASASRPPARPSAKLRAALDDLRRFRVLDPACGSGNFLFVAYREMKRLERDLLVAPARRRREARAPRHRPSPLTQFFGLDVVPFAVELAKVTLMLAKELELREAANLPRADGLLSSRKTAPARQPRSANPLRRRAFHRVAESRRDHRQPAVSRREANSLKSTATTMRRSFTHVFRRPEMADFCIHWFRIAHDALAAGGRAGLVGTNTIRQNESREASLDYIVENGGRSPKRSPLRSGAAKRSSRLHRQLGQRRIARDEDTPHATRRSVRQPLGDRRTARRSTPSLSTAVDVYVGAYLWLRTRTKALSSTDRYPVQRRVSSLAGRSGGDDPAS